MHIDVLVVDDDPDLRSPLVELLRDEGFSVDEAGDADGLLEALATKHPTLVLLDLTLPGTDLHGVLEGARLRELTTGSTIVALTGLEDALRVAGELGLDGVLQKPFNVDEMLSLARKCCRHSGSHKDADQPSHHPTP